MAVHTWSLQGTSPTTIASDDLLQFAGSDGFDDAISVNSWNDSTHVESSVGANESSGNTPNNVKFISETSGTGGDSQADWGDGTEDLDAITDGECTLKINFADASSVAISNHVFYADDGSTPANGPTGVNFRAAESGDANWTEAEGSASGVSITDSSASTSHDFYIAVSASPTSVGEKSSFRLVDSLTYT